MSCVEEAERHLGELLSPGRPEAIVCGDNLSTIGAMKALRHGGCGCRSTSPWSASTISNGPTASNRS